MTVEWIDPGMSPQPAPLLLPQDLYDEIMALPDGADLSEYFVSHDPAWVIKEIRLSRSEGAEASIACTSRIDLGVAPPAGAQPGTELDTESGVEGWAIDSVW